MPVPLKVTGWPLPRVAGVGPAANGDGRRPKRGDEALADGEQWLNGEAFDVHIERDPDDVFAYLVIVEHRVGRARRPVSASSGSLPMLQAPIRVSGAGEGSPRRRPTV